MEHTKEQVKKELEQAMQIAKDSPNCTLSDEELKKRYDDLSTDENLETLSKLLTVADGDKPEAKKHETTTITARVLKETADRLTRISEEQGIPLGEQIDRMTFKFHPYDVGLAVQLICEEIVTCTINFDQPQFYLTLYMVLNVLKKCLDGNEPESLKKLVDEMEEILKSKGAELPEDEAE